MCQSSEGDGVIAWHENKDGAGGSWTMHTILTASQGKGIFAIDLDGDGDVDVVVCDNGGNIVEWYHHAPAYHMCALA